MLGAVKEFDINQLITEVTASFTAHATDKNIDLSLSGTIFPITVSGDADNLRELVANLIENAILYTPGGGKVMVRGFI